MDIDKYILNVINNFTYLCNLRCLILSGLLAYTMNTGDLKAQNNPHNTTDSSVVKKEIFYDVHMYDEITKKGVDGAAELSAKYSGEDIYKSFSNLRVYVDGKQPIMDENGNFSGSFRIFVFDKISTGIKDRQPLAPSGYALSNNWPEPFDTQSKIEILTKERELADLVLYNVIGQEVFRKKDVDLSAGVNAFRFSGLDNLPSGMYAFATESNKFLMREKGIKIKGFSGTSKGSSSSKSYNNSGISIQKIAPQSYANNFTANKSTQKNLEQNNGGECSVEDVLVKQGIYTSGNPFERAMDTMQVGWGKNPEYWTNFIQDIPLNGVNESKDSVIYFVYPEGFFKFNNYIKGENGVDTIKHFYNRGSVDYNTGVLNYFADESVLNGITTLFGKGDGSAIDSLKLDLSLIKK